MSEKTGRVRESDFEYYERQYYKDLKDGCYRLESKSLYRCPFCRDNDYSLNELLKHAGRFETYSQTMRIKELAKHSALRIYIERHLGVNNRSEKVALDKPRNAVLDGSGNVRDDKLRNVVNDISENVPKDQVFVWPWAGIVGNIATEFKDGRRVGESGTNLREMFTLKGFHPTRVHPLWNRCGHSGFAIVEFTKDWKGFTNAMNFERSFEAEHCGKRDYFISRNRGNKLYGWVARDDDYLSKTIIGDYLRKNGDLKSVSEKQAEEERRASLLVSNLANTLKVKNEKLEQVCINYDDVNVTLKRVMNEKEAMMESYNSGKLKFEVNCLYSYFLLLHFSS